MSSMEGPASVGDPNRDTHTALGMRDNLLGVQNLGLCDSVNIINKEM